METTELAAVGEVAIRVTDLWKKYRRYHEKHQTLKDTVLKLGRAKYDEFWALSGVSLEVKRGDALGIIGENGSGKSTLLKILARILRPTMGKVEANGKVSALLELGAGFHPDLTGAENIYLNASILGLSKKLVSERFDQIVEFAGLQDFIDTPVRNYSSGMYARLGFSVAVNVDPDILLVDEVLAVGDEFFQKKCFDKMAEFKAAGKTIILVSHSLGQVEALCERAVFLHQGVVHSAGNTGKVISDYLDYVKNKEEETLALDQGLAGGKRWGSGEVIIESIRLLNEKGEESYLFETGDQVEVEISYSVEKKVKEPVFGVAIFRNDGIYCYGVNTKLDQFSIPQLKEPGKISIIYESLPLLTGSYRISAAVFDSTAEHSYDFHEQIGSFRVESKREDHGLAYFAHQWKWEEKEHSKSSGEKI